VDYTFKRVCINSYIRLFIDKNKTKTIFLTSSVWYRTSLYLSIDFISGGLNIAWKINFWILWMLLLLRYFYYLPKITLSILNHSTYISASHKFDKTQKQKLDYQIPVAIHSVDWYLFFCSIQERSEGRQSCCCCCMISSFSCCGSSNKACICLVTFN